MRKVHLIRPRNIMASLVTVNVFLDDADKPYGKLDNFSTGILEVDEGEHVVRVQPRLRTWRTTLPPFIFRPAPMTMRSSLTSWIIRQQAPRNTTICSACGPCPLKMLT